MSDPQDRTVDKVTGEALDEMLDEVSISRRTFARIQDFRLIDDVFMRVCFGHGVTCA